jgi:hypothetical protein
MQEHNSELKYTTISQKNGRKNKHTGDKVIPINKSNRYRISPSTMYFQLSRCGLFGLRIIRA